MKIIIIGLGKVGVLAANAAVDLGMNVLGYDPYLSVDAAWSLARRVKKAASYDEIYANSDYITIHVPLNDETRDLVDAAAISKMKDGVRILNFARGGLVNDVAIVDAVKSGKVGCYVIDFPSDAVLGVDGIIAIPSGEKSSVYEDVKRRGIPTVMLDRYYEDIHDIDVVSTDNYQAARMAVDHLVGMGHRRIGCVQGNSDTVTSRVRARGYRDAMKSHGLEASIMLRGSEFSIESSYDSTRDMLSDSCPPTAILALSNKILLGAIRSIQEKGLRVPEDISILSFDDNSLFNFLSPKITCIAQPVHEMGLKAVETLIAKIKGETETSRMFLSPSLVIRESVKRI